ncbi:alpha-N-arabinofuranosidase [Paenibacillaceae bacterium GAS479]|nr:alpha-N-arabinofuranosidase [Paenibacillaceae bacterium GAS479]
MKLKKRFMVLLSALTLASTIVPLTTVSATANPVISFNANTNATSVSPLLFGGNHRYYKNGIGMYDSVNQQVYPDFENSYNDIGLKTMRYPGGTIANLFQWQRGVGNGNNSNPDSGLPQIHGKTFAPEISDFDLDAALKFSEDTGTEMTYMYNMGNGNPTDAANLVQYLNGTNTSNPYVQLRISNGHPAPYNINYFEIGNETYLGYQKYWLNGIPAGQDYQNYYVNGGTVSFTKQPVVLKGDWSSLNNKYSSTGVNGQQVYVAYGPVTAGTDAVYVDNTAWTKVATFAGYGPNDPVYQLDNNSGLIKFGNGVNGKIPPAGAAITVSYSSYHFGYKDYITAMKSVDPSIKVLSNLHDGKTIAALAAANVAYDGMSIHPYTVNQNRTLSLIDYYKATMSQVGAALYEVNNLQRILKNEPLSGGIVYPSEYGLGQDSHTNESKNYQLGLGSALITAKYQFNFIQNGVPVAAKHSMIDDWATNDTLGNGPAAIFNSNNIPGSSYNFSQSATAHMFKMLVNMTGSTALNAPSIQNMPTYTPPGTNANPVNSLNAVATKDANGDLYVLVMNEDPTNDYATSLNIANYTPGATAAVWKLGEGLALDQLNSSGQAPVVVNQVSTIPVSGSSFTYTFPAHTLTAIKLTGSIVLPSDGSTAHYKLNETSGSIAADSSGNNLNGTISSTGGTATWVSQGKKGGALDLAPVGTSTFGDYFIRIPNFFDPAATDFTMAAWVKLDQASNAGSNQTIFAQEGNSGRSILYRDVNSGQLRSYLGGVTSVSTGTIPTGTWTHVALVKSGSNLQFYINGVLDSTRTATTQSSTGDFRIGAHKSPSATSANWNGAIDEAHLSKKALTATEINNLYNVTP